MKINFLHNHPRMESELGLDKDHVIVDKKDWELILQFLYDNDLTKDKIIENNEAKYKIR